MSAEALDITDEATATAAPPCDVQHANRITNLDPPAPSSDPPHKPVSEAKLAANRKNAAKSTGPRSPEGKKTVSQNARKHGCSQSALLEGECDATYEIFEAELKEDLRPRSAMQWHLFSQICQLLWKLQRMADAERHIYAQNRTDDQSACQTLAAAFLENPTKNPFLLFERYHRQLRNSYLRLLSQLRTLQKDPPKTYDEEFERPNLTKARQAIENFITNQSPPAEDAHFNLTARISPSLDVEASPQPDPAPQTTNNPQQTPEFEIKPTETPENPSSASESPPAEEKFNQTNPPPPDSDQSQIEDPPSPYSGETAG